LHQQQRRKIKIKKNKKLKINKILWAFEEKKERRRGGEKNSDKV